MSGILGFIAQCEICPQRAVVDTQPLPGWVCPRCAAVAGAFGDVDVAQAEPIAPAVRLDLANGQYPNVMAQAGLGGDDDDYPIAKVRG